VYATILYYLHNREAVSAYLTDWLEWGRAQRRAQALNPPPVVVKLRRLKQQAAASREADVHHIVAEQVSLAREGDALWGDGEQALRSHHRTQV